MHNYNIVANTEAEKYSIIALIRLSGAKLTGVSGYGNGYYIQLSATPLQVTAINKAIAEGGKIA